MNLKKTESNEPTHPIVEYVIVGEVFRVNTEKPGIRLMRVGAGFDINAPEGYATCVNLETGYLCFEPKNAPVTIYKEAYLANADND